MNGALMQQWSSQIGNGKQYVKYNNTCINETLFWPYFDLFLLFF